MDQLIDNSILTFFKKIKITKIAYSFRICDKIFVGQPLFACSIFTMGRRALASLLKTTNHNDCSC